MLQLHEGIRNGNSTAWNRAKADPTRCSSTGGRCWSSTTSNTGGLGNRGKKAPNLTVKTHAPNNRATRHIRCRIGEHGLRYTLIMKKLPRITETGGENLIGIRRALRAPVRTFLPLPAQPVTTRRRERIHVVAVPTCGRPAGLEQTSADHPLENPVSQKSITRESLNGQLPLADNTIYADELGNMNLPSSRNGQRTTRPLGTRTFPTT